MLINSCQMIYEEARCKNRLCVKWALLRNSIIFTHLLSGLILNCGLLHLYSSSKQLAECQKSLLHRQRYRLQFRERNVNKIHFCFIKISILRSKWFKFHIHFSASFIFNGRSISVTKFTLSNKKKLWRIWKAIQEVKEIFVYGCVIYANQKEKKEIHWIDNERKAP